MNRTTTVVLVLAALGCSKKESSPSSTSEATPPAKAADKPAKAAPDFAAWDLEGKAKVWQGNWVVRDNGSLHVWTITGDKLESWDGTASKTFKLQVVSPCKAYLNPESTGVGGYPHEFTVVGGKLQKMSMGGGYKKGAEAIFCDPSGDLYTVDAGGKCILWKEKFGEWEKTDAECGFKKNAQGADVFFHKGSNEGEFAIEGDAIVSKLSSDFEGAADQAAAKALRDSKSAAK